jgi:uncharacterized membrane protein (UPF0127 family)
MEHNTVKFRQLINGTAHVHFFQYCVCVIALLFFLSPIPFNKDSLAQRNADLMVVFLNSKGQELCRIKAELAVTDEEQSRGLMFRKDLSPDSGMLFVYQDDDMHSFWMKSTYIPLDMIFVNSRNEVKHIHYGAKPLDETSISSRYPAQYILEINAGRAKKCNIRPGTKMSILHNPR